jgi:hypothetical protein
MSVKIISIAYDVHLVSGSELISFYNRIRRAGRSFIINRGARQAIPFIRLNVRGSSCGGALLAVTSQLQ